MKIVDKNYMGTIHSHHSYCLGCYSKHLINHEGHLVCEDCGMSFTTVHLSDELGYKEAQEVDFRPQFTYKKETHLDEWLRRFESKENKEIPQEILDKVIVEAYK
jgi:predicted amidophosphoribosyltransferase